MDVRGVAAIVTGGGTGMGGAAAQELARQGARVTVLGRRLEVVESMAERIGGLAVSCDVGDEESVANAFARAREAHGPARIVINSAADGRLLPALDAAHQPVPMAIFREIITTNLFGSFHTIRQGAAEMALLEPLVDGSRGLIINVSSIGSLDGGQGGIAYIASKGALDAMTLSLAREFGDLGIRVLTIAPGPVTTPMAEAGVPPEMRKAAEALIPFPKRSGTPEEFAELVLHLCNNNFLNGTIIRFDGAMRAPYRFGAQGEA